MRVVALIRVSTERQADQGASLDAQERAYRAMADKEGWETVEVFRGHESASQATSDRRLLLQLLACVKEQQVDAIWVYEQSRLSRGDQLEFGLLMRELTAMGVKVMVNGVVRDPASIDDGLMLQLQSLLDHTECRRIRERMDRGKRERARQGKRANGLAPYGYRNPAAGEPGKTRGVLEIVEEQAVVVRRIFEMFVQGSSDHKITAALNRLGIPSPRGGTWCQATVRRILINPVYIGTQASYVWQRKGRKRSVRRSLTNPDAIVVPDVHPPIISRELWDAAQTRPKQPNTRAPRLLVRLLYVNGEPFGGFSDHGKRQYRATSRRAGAGWLPAEETDDRVWGAFAALATGPEFVEGLLRRAQNPHRQDIVRLEIEHLEEQLGKHRRRLDRLVGMRADDEISKNEFLTRRDAEDAAISRLESELAEQRAQLLTFDASHAARVVNAVRALMAGRTRLTRSQQRRVLTSIVERVDLEAERVARPFERDEQGQFRPGEYARWEIRKIEFRLALPPGGAASSGAGEAGGPVGAPLGIGRDAGDGGPLGASRPCQSTTTS